MDYWEKYYIKELHSHHTEGGYNVGWGGENSPMKGRHHSDETRKQMSIKSKERKNSPETIARMVIGKTGQHPSEETRRRLSIAKRGENNPNFGKKIEGSSSKYHGISKSFTDVGHCRWDIHIKINGISKYIKRYGDEEVAAHAYDKYVIEHGLPNPLNFPEDYPERNK